MTNPEIPIKTILILATVGGGPYVAVHKHEFFKNFENNPPPLYRRFNDLPVLDVWWFMLAPIRNPDANPGDILAYINSWVSDEKLAKIVDKDD